MAGIWITYVCITFPIAYLLLVIFTYNRLARSLINQLSLYPISDIFEKFGNLKFWELNLGTSEFGNLGTLELEVPGTWELRNLGTSELGNFGTLKLTIGCPTKRARHILNVFVLQFWNVSVKFQKRIWKTFKNWFKETFQEHSLKMLRNHFY